MLKLNLLPPTRAQRIFRDFLQWCRLRIYYLKTDLNGLRCEFAGFDLRACLLLILMSPVLMVVCVWYQLKEGASALYRVGQAVRRIVVRPFLGIRRRINVKKAIKIAIREAGGEGRNCYTHCEEKLAIYEIRVEVPRTSFRNDDCKAMQMTVDIQDGRIVTSTMVPCEHDHWIVVG
jgi:hypothetical protein